MPTVVEDPYTQVAGIVETVITSEFTDLPYLQVHHDRIHESLGSDAIYHVGISPDSTGTRSNATQETDLTIQFYGPFSAEVNPYQEVDPRPTANHAERLRAALSRVRVHGTSQVWYFTIGTVRFPTDPTGNKTRFEMTLTALGDDRGIMETIG